MAEEQKEQKESMTSFIDSTFKLVEMHDEMQNTINQFELLTAKQQHLIDVLEKEDKDGFADVIEQMKSKLTQYKAMLKAQKYRRDRIQNLLGLLEHSDDVKLNFAISMLFEATGLINPEGLSMEERSDYEKPEQKATEEKA